MHCSCGVRSGPVSPQHCTQAPRVRIYINGRFSQHKVQSGILSARLETPVTTHSGLSTLIQRGTPNSCEIQGSTWLKKTVVCNYEVAR